MREGRGKEYFPPVEQIMASTIVVEEVGQSFEFVTVK